MKRAFLLVIITALAACGRPGPVTDNAEAGALLPDPLNNASANPTGGPPTYNAGAPAAAGVGSSIPAALRGRRGLSPGDCTSTRGDAKGLLVIGAGELLFYESRAVPSPGIQTSANSASGNFAFTGEGQEWTKYEALQVNGTKLKRTERDPIASFNYARC